KYRALAESFHPTGLANFHVTSGWRPEGASPDGGAWENHYVIDFHDATVNYEPFPMRLEKVRGTLVIEPDHWESRKFEGTHGAGKFFTGGRSRRDAGGKEHVDISLFGRGVLLDDELRAALVGAKRDEWQRVWATFNPEGRIDFDGTVHLPPSEGREPAPEIVLTVWPRGCPVTPKFFAYSLDDLRGKVHYEKDRVELENVTASHQD